MRQVTIQAIGPEGWVVVERTIDYATRLVVEQAVDAVRAAVRAEAGWNPRILVLDGRGRNVNREYGIEPW